MADPVTVAVARVQAIDTFNAEAQRLAKSLGIDPPAVPQGLFAKDADLRSLHWTREAAAFLKRANDRFGEIQFADGLANEKTDASPAKTAKRK